MLEKKADTLRGMESVFSPKKVTETPGTNYRRARVEKDGMLWVFEIKDGRLYKNGVETGIDDSLPQGVNSLMYL